ncbi:MAG: prepilin-type N-terminal cleavage/methylation domain-containing protein [Elusimicrobiota bacterium]
MNKVYARESGFTLIELLITIVISSFIVFSIGMILIQTQLSWQKGRGTINQDADSRYCRLMIERELRKATSVYVGTPASAIRVWTIYGDTETIRQNGTNIELYSVATGSTLILLQDVVTLQFVLMPGSDCAQVNFTQRKVTDMSSGGAVSLNTSFVVQFRNKFT